MEKIIRDRTRVLEQSLFELENSKEQLLVALKKEKELNDMKSRFVTMASHEFRTPLSTIASSISLIEKYKLLNNDEKHQKHVQRVKSAITNMTLLLSDFLSAEKLSEGRITAKKTEFSLKSIAVEIIDEMNNLLRPGQTISYVHEGIETVMLDKQMIQNSLMNLISNASKFSGENKRIEIYTNVSPMEIIIRVKDEGIGIPEEEHVHMFQRFFRAKNAININGTGLGLSIVTSYLELLNGRISFTSELNRGTTFTISIPNSHFFLF